MRGRGVYEQPQKMVADRKRLTGKVICRVTDLTLAGKEKRVDSKIHGKGGRRTRRLPTSGYL